MVTPMNEKPTKAAQQDALRLKIEAAKYRLESARTWAGMGWGHPTLSPVRQQEVLDILTEACALLDAYPAPAAWLADDGSDVVTNAKLETMSNHCGSPGLALSRRYNIALYAALPAAQVKP